MGGAGSKDVDLRRNSSLLT